MELLTISDVMKELGIGRKQATKILNLPGCPKIPRVKGQQFLVPRQAFYTWLNSL